MAQETRIAPIEFSNAPTQVLLSIAENKQQDAARRQQLAFEQQKYLRGLQDEEMKRRYENQKNFNTIIQNKDWSKETRDLYLDQLIKKYSDPNFSSSQYQSEIGKDLSTLSNYQKYRDNAYQVVDDYVKNLPDTAKSGFDANTFKNDFIKNALFDKDGKPKTLDQLQSEQDVNWLDQTFKDGKYKYYDVASAYSRIPKIIKEAAESTIKVPGRDRKGRVLTSTSSEVKFKPLFERMNDKTGKVELRVDDAGYIEDDVYNALTSYQDIDALAERSARKFITDYNNSSKDAKKALMGPMAMKPGTFVDKDNDGLPDLLGSEDVDLIKKGFLTDYIKKQMPVYEKDTESTKIISLGGSGGTKKNDTEDFINQVVNVSKTGTGQDLVDLLYRMRAGNGKFEVTNVFVNSKDKGFRIEFNTGDFDEDGNPIKSSRKFNPSDRNFQIDLANFYQKATGSDAKLERGILTGGASGGKKTGAVILNGQ